MVVDSSLINLNSFLEKHQKLTDMLIKLEHIENILTNDQIRYLYLASLISSDKIYNFETANDSLQELMFLKNNIDYLNLDDNILKAAKRHIEKGINIVNNELNNYKDGIDNQKTPVKKKESF